MERRELIAYIRNKKGKEAAKKLRKTGYVPAIFYGPNTEPIPLSINQKDIHKALGAQSKTNVIIDLIIAEENGDKKTAKKMKKLALIKEMQVDYLRQAVLHVDFYEVSMDRELEVEVPVKFVGKSIGEEKGGQLQELVREIRVRCLPGKIPDFIEADVSSLDFGHSLHAADLPLPEGVTIADDLSLAVATLIAPPAMEEAEEEAAEEEEEAAPEKQKREEEVE